MPATLRDPKSRSSRSRWRKNIVGGLSIALPCHSTPSPIDSRAHLRPSVLRRHRHRKSAIPHGSTSAHQDCPDTRVDRSRLVWRRTARVTPLIFALSSRRVDRKQLSSANRFPELHRSAGLRCANPMERRNSACGGVGDDLAVNGRYRDKKCVNHWMCLPEPGRWTTTKGRASPGANFPLRGPGRW